MKQLATLVVLTLVSSTLAAQTPPEAEGHVQIPVELYNQLVEKGRTPTQLPRPAPASYALGSADVNVAVSGDGERATGTVRVTLAIQVLEDDWVVVPVLPTGTPVESVSVNGSNVQLINSPDGLLWSSQKAGAYTMALSYRVDARHSDAGSSLAVPLPEAAAIRLDATLPGSGLDVAVIPSAGTRVTASGDSTRINATVPTARGVQISWRPPAVQGFALSRATYRGTLTDSAVAWTGQLGVELFSDESLTLQLLPRSTTLSQVQVDGSEAAILVDGQRFATLVRGRGRHTITVGFEVPVIRQDGPPRIELDVPAIPVSRFELTLPGKKEVSVTPASSVSSKVSGNATLAVANVPLTGHLTMTWAEAVPEEIKTEVRANAGLYHAVWAEEGVLYVRALIDYEITRGETNVLRFTVPPEVQVNRIESPSGAVADWRITGGEATVFLDRQVQGNLQLEIAYDRSLGTGGAAGPVEVPLLRSRDAQRQRGMVALLSSKDLALKPVDESGATRVGENQLPAFVRQAVEMTVAHTFKYVEQLPALKVEVSAPERQQGRFDAQVDTLISLGDVTLKGSASVELDVKQGTIMELTLGLPEGVNLLSLTGPSVRNHKEETADGEQRIDVQFTQDMEGQFRLEVAYERILSDAESEVIVPTLRVHGAEVEQGRLAVEALSAVEVRPATVEQLTSLEISELPQQLILRTTNPILMAYKYVHADPPHRLGLTVTRHEVLDVLDAAIDRAEYATLFTKDGLAVTRANFVVRNSREQFLRVDLPEDAEVWSVFVDGQPEKPAKAESGRAGSQQVLIKIIHSTEGFPVELIYQMPTAKIGGFWGSRVTAELPRPDILATNSRWEVFLPADVHFLEPDTNMEIEERGTVLDAAALAEAAKLEGDEAGRQVIEPLHLTVPTSGQRWVFTKLYANQKDGDPAYFVMPYTSGIGVTVGRLLSGAGAILFWMGLGVLIWRRGVARNLAVAAIAGGAVLVVLVVTRYHVGAASPALVISVLAALAFVLMAGRGLLGRLGSRSEDE